MDITVDKDVCVGCGICVAMCPNIFELGQDNKSHVKDGDHSNELECAKKAAGACPVGAINVKE